MSFGVVTGMYIKIDVFWGVLLEHTASTFTVSTKVHGITSQKMYTGPLFYWTTIGGPSCWLFVLM
jgi:hypothetical protein